MNNITCVTEEKKKCFGCRACANICPMHAIKMQEDEEGFFYPIVDEKKCTHCGLCKKACPSLGRSEVFNTNFKTPECYAIMASDEIRAQSSSGGAFSLLANYVLEKGGYVCGAAYTEGSKLQHILIHSEPELCRLRGSKYLQSDTNTVYSEIKKLLAEGKLVLFSGTPCQTAGLNKFLGKLYENLITVDLICHGVPPQKIFDKYLSETIGQEEFIDTTFRDKKSGWTVYATTTTTTTTRGFPMSKDTYLRAFLKNMCLRPSCGACPFTNAIREADFTIGDYWAIERFDKKLNDGKGTSLVITHSEKAKKIFAEIKNNMAVCVQTPLKYASFYNITLYTPLRQHPNRKAFFRLFNEGKPLKEIVEYVEQNEYDCAILNFWTFKNAGGILLAYALQDIISKLGYTSRLVTHIWPEIAKAWPNSINQKFAKKYLDITAEIKSFELKSLNKATSRFVFGSDCIWYPWGFKNLYFGDFVDFNKIKIAYAPSFGNEEYNQPENDILANKYYLSRFDNISVREKNGLDILKNRFGIDNAVQVLDPTLVADKEIFENLVKKADFKETGYITNYYVGKYNGNDSYHKLNEILKNENVKTLTQNELDLMSIEDWAAYIKNSRLVITNSFHACCFALIFNVPFYVYKPEGLDFSRFDSLLPMLGLEGRVLEKNINNFDLAAPIDWGRVNDILAREREYSLKWLKKALETPKDFSKIDPADAIIRDLDERIRSLSNIKTSVDSVSKGELSLIANYNKHYRRYLKYKILSSFIWGQKRKEYKNNAEKYHEKIKLARRLRKCA